MKRYKRKKGKIQSKKTEVDGIKFRSKLEAFTYRKLKTMHKSAEVNVALFFNFIFSSSETVP